MPHLNSGVKQASSGLQRHRTVWLDMHVVNSALCYMYSGARWLRCYCLQLKHLSGSAWVAWGNLEFHCSWTGFRIHTLTNYISAF